MSLEGLFGGTFCRWRAPKDVLRPEKPLVGLFGGTFCRWRAPEGPLQLHFPCKTLNTTVILRSIMICRYLSFNFWVSPLNAKQHVFIFRAFIKTINT